MYGTRWQPNTGCPDLRFCEVCFRIYNNVIDTTTNSLVLSKTVFSKYFTILLQLLQSRIMILLLIMFILAIMHTQETSTVVHHCISNTHCCKNLTGFFTHSTC